MVDVFVATKKKKNPLRSGLKAKASRTDLGDRSFRKGSDLTNLGDQKVSPERRKEVLNELKSKSRRGMGPRYITVAERLYKHRRKGKIMSFQIMPRKVKFETQEAKEKVILLLRRHWITQVRWMIMVVIMMLSPIILKWIPIVEFMPKNYQVMTVMMWYLLALAVFYEKFISWFYHVFIVTDERIIDIDFYHLLYKEISEAKIDNVEDVTYRQGGMLKAMLNYGEVSLQTAAEKREFMIESVPEPNRIVKILNELKLEEEHEKIEGRVR